MRALLLFFLLLLSFPVFADNEKILNVYAWASVIPDALIQKFEDETGIKVNFSTYDSNETMFAKLRASENPGYDVIEPSSYYVERMRKQQMLEKLDKHKLPNYHNLNPDFLNEAYDPKSEYSIPYMWGVTGIFVNTTYHSTNQIQKWSDFWDKKYRDQLLILNDSREAFSMALIVLGYPANDTNPEHIRQAFLKLKELMPNIKLFNSEAIISILIDDDATLGMVWNGDVVKASKENKNVKFVYPKDGFTIWIDNFAIPKGAPHLENAYKFLNFMMQAENAKQASIENGYPTANLAAQNLLPAEIKNDPVAYPPHDILKHGQVQTDIGEDALALYEKYWEELKMGG